MMDTATRSQATLSLLLVMSLSCAVWGNAQGTSANTRPIIGILAMDTKSSPYGRTFISSTYVKYLEQAGARVVPIRGDQPTQYYLDMVNMTNGILIPGGAVNFATSLIGRSAKIVYNRAIELNQKGDYYPIWGTCMGFQLLCYLTQGDNLLKPTDSNNITWPLTFSPAFKTSRMFGSAPEDLIKIMSTRNVTQNQHSYSILTPVFEESKLSKFFTKLTTNLDRNGVEFISSVEAKDYPIYGVQWHPEKASFNWNPNYNINHDEDAVRVGQYMANFFVTEARKSQHRFPNVAEEADNMIDMYKQVYYNDGSFNNLYFIDQ